MSARPPTANHKKYPRIDLYFVVAIDSVSALARDKERQCGEIERQEPKFKKRPKRSRIEIFPHGGKCPKHGRLGPRLISLTASPAPAPTSVDFSQMMTKPFSVSAESK